MPKHRTSNIEHRTSNFVEWRGRFDVRCSHLVLWLIFLAGISASAQETQRQYLSGHDKDDAVPWEFQCTYGANSGFWTNLPVPSHWDMRGFGTLSYKKDQTNAWNEQGLYAHNFTVPAEWSDRRIFLVFDGVMTDTAAQINGQSVGPVHQGSFYRFKYEVTKLLKHGATNRLEVTVAKHSANESVNKAERLADYWVFGGIFRPVYLEAVPAQFIERAAIDARADGTLAVDVFANGAGDAETIDAQLTDLDGNPVGGPVVWSSIFRPSEGSNAATPNVTLVTKITAPRQWTAETPNLYSVEVRLKRGGEVLHRFNQRFGFRTMEVRDADGLYVNGRRVVLKGANRHSFWPDSGRCLSEKIHRLDIETMKDMNMNAVRMSHYPPDEKFLDLCDELGLYVLDELAGWHNKYDSEVGPKLVREMVERDVNHPSILFWDNGNEGGWNTNLDHIFPELDPQHRRVLHPWATFSGLNTSHYLAYDVARVACLGTKTYFDGAERIETNDPVRYIYMPTEFMHGLFDGGAAAGLDDYWRMMTASKVLGGGFIWVLADEGVKRPDTGEIDTAGNQAPDGIVGPYRQREGSFYAIKEIWSPIQVTRETNGTFTVENHYSFTDASQCQFTWELRRFPRPGEQTSAGHKVVAAGKVAGPMIAPGGKGNLQIPRPEIGKQDSADALAIRVNDPSGRELWTWVWPEPRLAALAQMPNNSSRQAAFAGETDDLITMKFEGLTVAISKRTGLLAGNSRGLSLTNGPRPATGDFKLTGIETNISGGDAVVTATFSGALNKVVWRMRSDGWLQCDYSYNATGTNQYLGVLFDYPESQVRHKRWLGDGPYRVWKNRLRGATLGVWENDYNNTITGWRDWIYPEFKGCFANVYWMQWQTTEGMLTAVPRDREAFVQVLKPEPPPKELQAQAGVPLPDCGLAFLQGIPAIGSKFKNATFTGPQGQPNIGRGEYSGSVNFYFGDVP